MSKDELREIVNLLPLDELQSSAANEGIKRLTDDRAENLAHDLKKALRKLPKILDKLKTPFQETTIKKKINEEEKKIDGIQIKVDVILSLTLKDITFDSFERSSWDTVHVAPTRTIVRREEEITLIQRVRKTEEANANPRCPMNTSQIEQVSQKK